jgi:hypothetical protein
VNGVSISFFPENELASVLDCNGFCMTNYSWQPTYAAAVLELGPAKTDDRFREALTLMQMRLSNVEIGSVEHRALVKAVETLSQSGSAGSL